MRKLTMVVLVAALAVSVSACGRKGRPIPPEGATYPRSYPEVTFPAEPAEGQGMEQSQ
jgi:predicted small lipoprotein YifL